MRLAPRSNVHPHVPLVAAFGLVLFGCTHMSEVSVGPDAEVVEPGADSAEPVATANAPDDSAPPDAAVPPDAETPPADAVAPHDAAPPASKLPENPLSFRVALSGSACFGDCPTYTAAMDEQGQVTFVGKQCVARPGVYRKKVSATQARAFYDQLRNTAYGSLNERYAAKVDGCPQVFTDAPTSTWRVEADGASKSLTHYQGCEGLPQLDALDALESVLQSAAEVTAWLKPAPFNCGSGPMIVQLGRFRVSQNGVTLGVLTLRQRDFEFVDCAGQNQQRGEISLDNLRYQTGRCALLGENDSRIKLSDALGDVGTIVIELDASPSAKPPTLARALRENDELALELKLADSCTD